MFPFHNGEHSYHDLDLLRTYVVFRTSFWLVVVVFAKDRLNIVLSFRLVDDRLALNNSGTLLSAMFSGVIFRNGTGSLPSSIMVRNVGILCGLMDRLGLI